MDRGEIKGHSKTHLLTITVWKNTHINFIQLRGMLSKLVLHEPKTCHFQDWSQSSQMVSFCYGRCKCLALLAPSSYTFGFIFYLFNCKFTKLISMDSFKMVNMTPTEKRKGLQLSIVPNTTKQPFAKTASRAKRGPRIQLHQAGKPRALYLRGQRCEVGT